MPNSQNGWPVDRSGANQDRNPIYGNVKVPNGVLKGDVAVVLRYVARRYHETVEPLKAGTCWGWFVKSIEGSSSISNHASGTAIDLNADQHPMGVAAGKNMSAREIAACRAIVKACNGVVRWGGDYTGRPDPMHWEVVGSKAAVAALAKKIRSEEDELTPQDKTWIEGLFKAYKDDYANQVLTGTKLPGTTTPGSTYTRSISEETGDVWSLLMRGKTLGGDPMPAAGVLAKLAADVAELKATVAKLSAPAKP